MQCPKLVVSLWGINLKNKNMDIYNTYWPQIERPLAIIIPFISLGAFCYILWQEKRANKKLKNGESQKV